MEGGPTRAQAASGRPARKEHDVDLNLTEEQRSLLQEILDREYRDARYEIADTDRSSFKDALRERNVQLRTILDLVGGPLPDREASTH